MSLTTKLFSFVATILVSVQVLAADVESIDTFRDLAMTQLLREAHDDVVGELIASGVSQTDAEQVFYVFVDDVANCLIGVTEQLSVRRGVDHEEFLSGLVPEGLSALLRDESEVEELVEPCLFDALANAGLNL